MIIAFCRASREERGRTLAGDALIPDPMALITHAITIDAPPGDVWPWLVQLGSGRAGWYAYDRIDNGRRPSARRIVPELQHIAVGEVMPWLPGATDGFVVQNIVPERALTLIVPRVPAGERIIPARSRSAPAPCASWALILDSLADGRTRLITRSRVAHEWLSGAQTAAAARGKRTTIEHVYDLLAKLPRPLLLVVAGTGHYLMESRMLRGIKRRAEVRIAPA